LKTRPHLIPALLISVMLLVAVAPLSYGYYQFLRWVTCAVGIYIAVMGYIWKLPWSTWVFGAVALLFNPLFPIFFTKQIWQPIDLGTAVLFGLSIFLVHEPDKIQNQGRKNE
jgi:hypothetical protein